VAAGRFGYRTVDMFHRRHTGDSERDTASTCLWWSQQNNFVDRQTSIGFLKLISPKFLTRRSV